MSNREIQAQAVASVEEMIARVKEAGLEAEAEVFQNTYAAWIRLTSSYKNAHPYVIHPEGGRPPHAALTVVDYTLNHWSKRIPGSPQLDDEAVLKAAARDEAWHRAEDRRMRIAAGEDIC